jgi:hypothetical protein
MTLSRLGTGRNLGQSRASYQFLFWIRYWICHCLHPVMAVGTGIVFNSALHGWHWSYNEQIGLQVHAVRVHILYFFIFL